MLIHPISRVSDNKCNYSIEKKKKGVTFSGINSEEVSKVVKQQKPKRLIDKIFDFLDKIFPDDPNAPPPKTPDELLDELARGI